MGNGAYTRDDCPDTERILGMVRKFAEEDGKVYISKMEQRLKEMFCLGTKSERNGTRSERDRKNIIERKVVVCGLK